MRNNLSAHLNIRIGDTIMNKTASIRSDNYLLTVEEAARELRISKWTIYQLIRSEELKTLTIASRRLVASDDLKDFIDKRRSVL